MQSIDRTAGQSTAQRKQRGHTLARPPVIGLDQPGRLRVAHVLALLGVSHSTFYSGLKRRPGQSTTRYPVPDGYDGKVPFWNTATLKSFLERGTCTRMDDVLP